MAFQGVPRRPLAHLVALAGVPVRNVGSEEHAWENKSGNVSAAHARSSGPALLLLTQGQGLGREAWWGLTDCPVHRQDTSPALPLHAYRALDAGLSAV